MPLKTAWVLAHGRVNSNEFCIPVPYDKGVSPLEDTNNPKFMHHSDTKLSASAIWLANWP